MGRFNRPELDMLRLFAFLLVLVAHSFPGRWNQGRIPIGSVGALGLTLFFVLSAYLIMELLRLEKQRTGHIEIRQFYLRRVLRIWPLLFSFIAISWLYGHLVPKYALSGGWILSMLLFYSNWYAAATNGFAPMPISPLWSLSIEEQFYLIWPSVVNYGSRRTGILLCLALFPISAAAIAWLVFHHANPLTSIWTNSLVQFQMFGAGALAAYALQGRVPRLTGWSRLLLFLLGIGCYVFAGSWCGIHREHAGAVHVVTGYLSAAAGSCMLLFAVLGMKTSGWTRPFRYLGRISYGLYVFHLGAIWVAVKLLGEATTLPRYLMVLFAAFVIAAAVSAASYRFVEKPFIVLKNRFAVVKSGAA